MKTKNIISVALNFLFYIVLTVALILVVSLFHGMKASGEEDVESTRSAYYHEMEEVFYDVLTVTLTNDGYTNAGINISSIINADGTREYKVMIHHDVLTRMDDDEKNEFIAELSNLKFTDPDVPVTYGILL